MYYWAEINEENVVLRVLPRIDDSNGDDGYISIVQEYGGNWIKASDKAAINGFRKNFPGPGYTYNESIDAFIPKKPYSSWTLNLDEYRWDPPMPYPNDGNWIWDEENKTWTA
jgi:hypothetical protein